MGYFIDSLVLVISNVSVCVNSRVNGFQVTCNAIDYKHYIHYLKSSSMAAGFNYHCEVGNLLQGPMPLEAPKAPVYLW